MTVFGIDIGGVIIDKANDGTDTSFFSDNFLHTTAVPGAFDAVKKLVELFGSDNIYLVSKCGKRVQEKTLLWLDHHDFYDITGVKRDNVKFCRERHEKAGICKSLGITHFVDDHFDVLQALLMENIGIEARTLYLFRPKSDEIKDDKYLPALDRVLCVDTWQEILERE